jgi:DNA uptake protein ComE-like DNA-binding protein
MSRRHIGYITLAMSLLAMLLASCSPAPDTSAYQAVCHGPPLGTVEQRNQAMEDGYEVNRRYDCITAASYAAVTAQQARWQAAHTPAALAQREAESAAQRRQAAARRVAAAAARASAAQAAPAVVDLRMVDVNTAPEAEIANVITVGPLVAAEIIAARNQRRFRDWEDLTHRVVGLSAAQPAVYASLCGLTVDGRSLEGAPPNPAIAAALFNKYQSRKAR